MMQFADIGTGQLIMTDTNIVLPDMLVADRGAPKLGINKVRHRAVLPYVADKTCCGCLTIFLDILDDLC